MSKNIKLKDNPKAVSAAYKRIMKYHAQIAKLSRNIEAEEVKILKNTKYREYTIWKGKGKNKKSMVIGCTYWTEDFVDEGTGEVVTIERNQIVLVDGKRVDNSNRPIQTTYRAHTNVGKRIKF